MLRFVNCLLNEDDDDDDDDDDNCKAHSGAGSR